MLTCVNLGVMLCLLLVLCRTINTVSWDTDPFTGVQYQRNPQAALTWHQARKSCQQQGADLLSIIELHEQSYISGLTNMFDTTLWIGLNCLDSESGWSWSNGNPFRYLNWAPGQPSSHPELRCAKINAAKAAKWESSSCNNKLGYICRKDNSPKLSPVPGNNDLSFCPSHWVPYAGNCYYLERNQKKMWREALSACHKEGGDLASIHSIEEQSFIISQSGYLPTDVLWIGLNDKRNQMFFEWSDNSNVAFTQWETGEPSHTTNLREDCVLVRGKEAKWSDYMCDETHGYMCKKKASNVSLEGMQEANAGCKPTWTRYRSFCYNIGNEIKTFQKAKQMCSEAAADLVNVADRYENAFLVSLVGFRPEMYFWIGFPNTVDRNTFTNFNKEMPDRKQGCVALMTGLSAGLWAVVNCSNEAKYICKKLEEGVVVTTALPTTLYLTCASGWTSLATRNVCYKIYKKESALKKTWYEAHDFCRTIGGDLLSMHSDEDLRAAEFGFEWAWIGLNSLYSTRGFVWTDGSPMDFDNWGFDEPEISGQSCVQAEPYASGLWGTVHCETPSNWICQIKRGVTPKPEPVITTTMYNTTEDGWILYNNTHYFINTDRLPMEAARAYCKKNFGELAVITGESERRFLLSHMEQGKPQQHYIGMVVDLDKSFRWLDGSPVTYTAWDSNKPDFSNNDETCVTMYSRSGYWNDINCGVDLPSICKRSSNFINATMAPTAVPEGGCALEWLSFQGKCYKIVVGNDKNWHEARSYCYSQGGNLVSIVSPKEQAFLTMQLVGHTEEFWTGLNDINMEMRFLWTDGSTVSYVNWAKGHGPEGHYNEMYDCVNMVASVSKLKGLWKVEKCDKVRAFICKRDTDSQIVAPPTTVLPKAFHKLGNDSYKLVAQRMRWDEARKECRLNDADLASILSPVAQAYLTLKIHEHNRPVWIGLNSKMTGGLYKWVDNWRLSYTQWGSEEPKHNNACVYVDVDRTWKTAPCTNTLYSLCKRSTDIAPIEVPELPGHCPETKKQRSWIPFRGHCYSFVSFVSDTWVHASVECQKMGAALVSVQDPLESQFIEKNVELLQDSAGSFWIGLYKTHEGEWMWIDNSAVDYTNWKLRKSRSEKCVHVGSDSGQWSVDNCKTRRSFICKTPKVNTTTEKPPPSTENVIQKASNGYAYITIPIVLTATSILGLGVLLSFCRK